MSGIFAASVSADSAGIRSELQQLQRRASRRGTDAVKIVTFHEDGTIGYVGATGNVRVGIERALRDARRYALVGCLYGAPSAAPPDSINDVPPFVSSDREWLITIDGIVTGHTGQQVADLVAQNGWTATHSLDGQFAILGVEHSSDGIYWACKAKPLYALHHPYDAYTMVSSQRDDLYGFYHESRSSSPFALGPYSAGRISREGVYAAHPLSRWLGSGSLILAGGGLDTAVATWDNQLTYSEEPTTLLHLDYGQKAREREWHATQRLAKVMADKHKLDATVKAERIKFDFFRLSAISEASSLTGAMTAVETNPQGGQAHDWFPARNTVFTALALSYAEAHGLSRVVTGINMEAAGAYPDNEMEWLNRYRELLPYALGDAVSIDLEAPLAGMSKADIVKLGEKIGYPFDLYTWSCYQGGSYHCGVCSSCRTRRAAFVTAGVTDPTKYEDEA